ncbi:hypothetical protein P0W64_17725 [Tsukamurella sp. 8F]|uniref:divisome protein SepX/GlpR n=1 Tax=unclassified Tsukamurella TaxID=2633480 RepID=UPI0023B988D8|nr:MULTISPECIES: gephyrin-like molybdotransferase receptor GlpR [unclassified Tsukamurella]MDF0532389.1 hypothetical protein [Tsukamurella sp. 8J]MDF0588625.1 hypothetical protein [Tsukamurella sp. 8F]
MPTSVLWVGLIVAWLVVLVPMFVARHPKVNAVSDATLKTRLLHRGGSARLQLKRKVRPMPDDLAPYQYRPDRSDTEPDAELDDAELDDPDLRETGADDIDVVEDLDRPNTVVARDGVEQEAHAYVDYDVDEPGRDLDSPTQEMPTVTDEPSEPARSGLDSGRLNPPTLQIDGPTLEMEPVEVSAPVAESETSEDTDDEPVAEHVETDEATDSDELDADDAYEDEAYEDEAYEDETFEDEAHDAPVEPIDGDESPRRRGGFDPENDARISAAKYRFRQRVTFVLGLLAVVGLVASVAKVPFAWYGFGAAVVALVVYLAYLRRTVRIESEIRRRRMARLARARREREREGEVVDGVPAYLRRYGCIVMEADDEDPAFDHLPRYRAEEFDFLRREQEEASELREYPARRVG